MDEVSDFIEQVFSHGYYCLLGIDFKASTKHKKSEIRPLVEEIEGKLKSNFTHVEILSITPYSKYGSPVVKFRTKSTPNN